MGIPRCVLFDKIHPTSVNVTQMVFGFMFDNQTSETKAYWHVLMLPMLKHEVILNVRMLLLNRLLMTVSLDKILKMQNKTNH